MTGCEFDHDEKRAKIRLFNCIYHAKMKFISLSQFVMENDAINVFIGQDMENLPIGSRI